MRKDIRYDTMQKSYIAFINTHTKDPEPLWYVFMLNSMCSLTCLTWLLSKLMKILPQAFRGMVVGCYWKQRSAYQEEILVALPKLLHLPSSISCKFPLPLSHRKWFRTPDAGMVLRMTFAPCHCKSVWFHMLGQGGWVEYRKNWRTCAWEKLKI